MVHIEDIKRLRGTLKHYGGQIMSAFLLQNQFPGVTVRYRIFYMVNHDVFQGLIIKAQLGAGG